VDQWRREWRQSAGGVMTVTFLAAVTWVSASQTFVTTKNGQAVHPSPLAYPLWICIAGFVVGMYILAATAPGNRLPWFGKAKATNPNFSLLIRHEFLPLGAVTCPDGTYSDQAIIWVIVHNEGPLAQFSAHFSDVDGLKVLGGDNGSPGEYFGKVAWEDVPSDHQLIGYKSRSKLMVLYLFRKPKAIWFELPHTAAWSTEQPRQMKGTTLEATAGDIRFNLTVVNETRMKDVTKRVHVRVRSDGSVAGSEFENA
jgi:hypothetical protein